MPRHLRCVCRPRRLAMAPSCLRRPSRAPALHANLTINFNLATVPSNRWGWGPPTTAARLMTPTRRFAVVGGFHDSSVGADGVVAGTGPRRNWPSSQPSGETGRGGAPAPPVNRETTGDRRDVLARTADRRRDGRLGRHGRHAGAFLRVGRHRPTVRRDLPLGHPGGER